MRNAKIPIVVPLIWKMWINFTFYKLTTTNTSLEVQIPSTVALQLSRSGSRILIGLLTYTNNDVVVPHLLALAFLVGFAFV